MKTFLSDISGASYTFSAAGKTVQLNGISTLTLDQVLAIVNTTRDVIIYNPTQVATGGTISGNIISLTYDTTSHSNTDNLMIVLNYSVGQTTMALSQPVVIANNQSDLPIGTPTKAALADAASNPTTISVGGLNFIYNGTTWDRLRAAGSSNAIATGLLGAGNFVSNGATWDMLKTPSADAVAVTGFGGQVLMGYNGTTYDRIRTASGDALSTIGWLAAGNIIFNGTGWDRMRSVTTADGVAVTGIAAAGNLVYNGSTWDRMRSLNNADSVTTLTGMPPACNLLYNGSGVNWDRMRTVSTGDAAAATGIAAAGNLLYNGSTWDRMRSANADGASSTGLAASIIMGYNGSTFDRLKTATGDGVSTTAFLAAGNMLYDGTGWNRMRSASGDAISSTGLPAAGLMLYNSSAWERARTALNGTNSTGTGLLTVAVLAQVDDTSPNTITENGFGNVRMAADRSLLVSNRAVSGAQSSVAGSNTSVTLLLANNSRKGAVITNDSTAILYIKMGATASATSYSVALAGSGAVPYSYYEIPFGYVGIIDGIWATSTGNARITELS